LAAQAKLEVAGAHVTKAEASLETARIRLGYTSVTADWTGGDDQRLVSERFVDEGDTVSANAPLMSIVELDPITGVIFVTEKDYARLTPGQSALLFTDAFANETFEGRISRIAPIFKEATRQARVELRIENSGHRLKPGMFIRVRVVLERVEDAVIVPETALTTRNDRTGIFLVDENTQTVEWREVKLGVREGDRVQIVGTNLSGRVVTLGQQMIDDGSAIRIPGERINNGVLDGEAKAE
jgi:RND family efflux transporter MFP subunit